MSSIELDILNEYIERLGDAQAMEQQSLDELRALLTAEKLPKAEDLSKLYSARQEK